MKKRSNCEKWQTVLRGNYQGVKNYLKPASLLTFRSLLEFRFKQQDLKTVSDTPGKYSHHFTSVHFLSGQWKLGRSFIKSEERSPEDVMVISAGFYQSGFLMKTALKTWSFVRYAHLPGRRVLLNSTWSCIMGTLGCRVLKLDFPWFWTALAYSWEPNLTKYLQLHFCFVCPLITMNLPKQSRLIYCMKTHTSCISTM